MRIVVGHDMEIARWGFGASGSRPIMFNAAHGIVDDSNTVVGAVMFTGWNGSDMEVHYYGPKTLSRQVVRHIFRFALKSGANRLTVRTRKAHMARGCKKLGAVFEGTCRYFYGPSVSEDDTAQQWAFYMPVMVRLAGFDDMEKGEFLLNPSKIKLGDNHVRR